MMLTAPILSMASQCAVSLLLLSSTTSIHEWDLLNGNVKINDPLIVTINSSQKRLEDATLIGYGGGGAVFAFSSKDDPLVKVSWSSSTATVRRECATLRYLQDQQIPSTEKCLAELPYPYDMEADRVMIVVSPYVSDAVASIEELASPDLQGAAVRQVCRTLVRMLANNVITIDVQPLISQSTGDVIFIDMTEAQVLRPPFSSLDVTLMQSFCTEMLALIPERSDLETIARVTLLRELDDMRPISKEAFDILVTVSQERFLEDSGEG